MTRKDNIQYPSTNKDIWKTWPAYSKWNGTSQKEAEVGIVFTWDQSKLQIRNFSCLNIWKNSFASSIYLIFLLLFILGSIEGPYILSYSTQRQLKSSKVVWNQKKTQNKRVVHQDEEASHSSQVVKSLFSVMIIFMIVV